MSPLHRHSSNAADWLNPLRRYSLGLVRCLVGCCLLLSLLNYGALGQTAAELFAQADSAYKAGDAGRAIQLYEKLLKIQPESVPARANLAVAFAHVGRYDDAVAQYNLALRRAPGNPDLLLNLALSRYKQAKFLQAAVDLEKVHRAQPENRQALYLLADCYLRMGRNKDVISLLQPVYDAGPEDRAVEYALGMALLHDGQIQQGEVIIDRVLKSGTSAGPR